MGKIKLYRRSRHLALSITVVALAAALAGGLFLPGLAFDGSEAEAAVGGGQTTTTTYTTSTTRGTTYTRKDLPNINAYSTRVLGYAASSCTGGEAWLVDQTFASASSSATVQSALADAASAVGAQCGDVSAAALDSSSTGNATAYLGDEQDHTEQSVTTTAAFGPTTILIGDEQSQTFFVAAGTVNYNTNTHIQTFMNQLYRTTVTTTETWVIKGSGDEHQASAGTPPSPPASTAGEGSATGNAAALTGRAAPLTSSSLPTTGFQWWFALTLGLPLLLLGSGLAARSLRN